MSQQYSYTTSGDDFLSQDTYTYPDSYQRHSNTYQPSLRSVSQEPNSSTLSSSRTVDSSVCLPGMALSFLHSCGLEPSDLSYLAELPEHLITVETLPKLLLQVKERKLSNSSASRPSTSQPLDDASVYTWERSGYTDPVEYPIDRPAQPMYPLPPEQVQSWQDRWGNPRRTTSSLTTVANSSSSSIPDYTVFKDTVPYYNTPKSPEAPSPSIADIKPRPLLSLKLQPPVIAPTKMEALDFNCKSPPTFPHVCCLCDISVYSTKEWLDHVSSREHTRSQLELVKKYPKWDQTVESTRRHVLANATCTPDRHIVRKIQDYMLLNRKEDSTAYNVPTRKEASDFTGIIPPVFPHLCVLCNTTACSEKDWSSHIIGRQHAKSQLVILEKYPKWDGTIQSSRRNDHTHDTRDGSSKKSTSDKMMSKGKDDSSSRVVSFTPLPPGDGISTELTAIAKHFGSVKKSFFLPNKGYIEMSCSADAKKLVKHYSVKQLKLKRKIIKVSFSCEYDSLREVEGNIKARSPSSHAHRRSSQGRQSTQRASSSPQRCSLEKSHSCPKRRHSSERAHSNPKRKPSSEGIYSSPKRRRVSEKTQSFKSHCAKEQEDSGKFNKSSNAEATKSSEAAEERIMSNSYAESMNSEDDLEGLEVIADDGEELVHDNDSEPMSDLESLPSNITDVDTEQDEMPGDNFQNADTTNDLKEGQKNEDHDMEEESSDEVTASPKLDSSTKQSVDEPTETSASNNREDAVDQPKEEQYTERVTNILEETIGKVLEVRNLPNAEHYTDLDFMKIITRYGDVVHHVLFHSSNKGFVEMMLASDAERVELDSKNQDIVLRGNILKIKVSEKYSHLPDEGFDVDDGDEIGNGEISKESSDTLNGSMEFSNQSLNLNEPVGTEFVRPVVGYLCSLCNLIYANEEEAKDAHCRSASHHQKVKEDMERSDSVGN